MGNASLLTAAQALASLLAHAKPIAGSEVVPTQDANGRVLAQAQTSRIDVPSADNSERDGYAIRAAECAGGAATFMVSQRIAAGQVPQPLQPGTAARIFTGAIMPEGADAVVMQEDCEPDGECVTIKLPPRAGDWVRRAGEDVQRGNVILPAGTRLRPQELGLAASVGLPELPVVRRVRVAVFSTGDELAMPGEELKPGAIYNSNRFTLRGLLDNLCCEVTDLGIVPDTLEATRAAMVRAAQHNDLIITSGGVSVGEEDHIRPAVQAEGYLTLWQLAIKPGKPLAFGAVNRAASDTGVAHFIGLPGNPVSVLIGFSLFIKPFILRLQRVQDVAPKAYPMRADFALTKGDRRNEFLRARINADGGLDLFPNQGSGVLTSTVWADGLIDNPPNNPIAPGDTVRFIPFSELLY